MLDTILRVYRIQNVIPILHITKKNSKHKKKTKHSNKNKQAHHHSKYVSYPISSTLIFQINIHVILWHYHQLDHIVVISTFHSFLVDKNYHHILPQNDSILLKINFVCYQRQKYKIMTLKNIKMKQNEERKLSEG